MTIIGAAVGEEVSEFDDDNTLSDVWQFVRRHMESTRTERAVVLLAAGGETVGEIWSADLFELNCGTLDRFIDYVEIHFEKG